MEFLKPILAVRQKEMQHRILAVVKQQRIPCRVLSAIVAVEVKVVAAVESAEPLHFILHGMRVHYIHDYGQAEFMGIIDKASQFIRCAEA